MNVISLLSDAGYCPRVPHTLTLTGHVAVALRRCMERRTSPANLLASVLVFSSAPDKRRKDTASSSGISHSLLKQVMDFPTRNSLTFSDALGRLSILASQSFSLRHSLAIPFSFRSHCSDSSSVTHLFNLSFAFRTVTLTLSVLPIRCPLSRLLT